MFHALPEPPAHSLTITVACQQQSWVLCMGASGGATTPGHHLLYHPLIACNPSAWETRKKTGERRSSLILQLCFPWRTHGCKGLHLYWDTQPAPKARTEEWSYKRVELQHSHIFCPPTDISQPWLGFKVATGTEESPRAEPRLAHDALAPTHPPPRPPAEGSGARLWLLLAGCPTTWPRAMSANVLV